MSEYLGIATAATSIGSRDKNQDVFYLDGYTSSSKIVESQYKHKEIKDDAKLHVFAVCDGIGMYKDSGIVAEIAMLTIKHSQEEFNKQINNPDLDMIREWCEKTLSSIKMAITNYCKTNRIKGSSTIVMLAIVGKFYVIVNSGDSSGFIVKGKDKDLNELTVRHNMATLKRMLGMEPVEEEENILLHHLGEDELVYAENYGVFEKNELFLICTDGITKSVENSFMLKKLKEHKNALYFVEYASKALDSDNCTSIVVDFSIKKNDEI